MRRLSINLLFIFAGALSTSSIAAQTPVGYVLELQGNWYLNRNVSSVLRRWQKLPPASSISIEKPTPDDYIVVVSLSGEIIDSRHCHVDNCLRPINLPRAPAQRSWLQVMFQGTMDLLLGSPDRYSRHGIRNLPALSDGVVKLEKGEIDFSPVLKNTGRYYLRWRARPRGGKAGNWSNPVSLNLKRGGTALVAVPDFKPGLYEVNLLRYEMGSYEPFASAWVLVSMPPEHENFAASFRQAVELTEQWESKVDSTTSRQFLHAHLDYLAGQARK